MSVFQAFRNAVKGWLDILGGRPAWRERFDLGASGLATALAWYLAVILVIALLQAASSGGVGAAQMIPVLAIYLLPIAGLALAIGLSVAVLRPRMQFNALFVPAAYAVTYLVFVGLLLSIVPAPTGPLLLALLGYLLYRNGRVAGGLSVPLAVAFAALCVVLLVALPLSLYMVVAPGQGPA